MPPRTGNVHPRRSRPSPSDQRVVVMWLTGIYREPLHERPDPGLCRRVWEHRGEHELGLCRSDAERADMRERAAWLTAA